MINVGFDAAFFRRQLEDRLRAAAAAADAGYPDNESLVIDPATGIPSLKPHWSEGQRPSAKLPEQEIKPADQRELRAGGLTGRGEKSTAARS